ncbi:MAG: polyprenyl synthetase family protein [Kocuria rhizophila]|nr:polyprenyl synthetase family protein [Kocuria rhizophila]
MTPTSSYTSSGTGRRSQEFTPATALRGFLAHSGRKAAELSPGYERVWERIAQVTEAGRGLQQELVMTSVEAYPARPTRPVLNAVAASFELLHTAIVLRADAAAQESTAPAPDAAEGASAAGWADRDGSRADHTSAAGDLALTGAYRLIATSRAPETRMLRLLEILDESVFHAAAGERLVAEVARRTQPVPHDKVLDAIRLAIAVPCYEAPLRAGAVLGGAPTAHVTALATIGRSLGVAHQLTGELRAAAGSPDAAGEAGSAGASPVLTPDRCTVAGVLVEAGDYAAEWQALRERAVRQPLGDDDVAHARDLLDRSGAARSVARMVDTAVRRAKDTMAATDLPPALAQSLTAWLERETTV